MAWTKKKAVDKVFSLLKKNGMTFSEEKISEFRKLGYANILGYNCKVANVFSGNNFRVRVSSEWFKGQVDVKPEIRTSLMGFDYQLLPSNEYLFAIYYLALRDYAFQLEEDKNYLGEAT